MKVKKMKIEIKLDRTNYKSRQNKGKIVTIYFEKMKNFRKFLNPFLDNFVQKNIQKKF